MKFLSYLKKIVDIDDFISSKNIKFYEFYSDLLAYIDKYNFLNFILLRKKKFIYFKNVKWLGNITGDTKDFEFRFSLKNNLLIIELPKINEFIVVDRNNLNLISENINDKNYKLIIQNNHIILNFKEGYSRLLKINENNLNYELIHIKNNKENEFLNIKQLPNYYIFTNKFKTEYYIFDLFLNRKLIDIKIKQYEIINSFLIIRLNSNTLELLFYDVNNLEFIIKSNNGYKKINNLICWELNKYDHIIYDSIKKERIFLEGINYNEKIMKIKQNQDLKNLYIISLNKNKHLFYSHNTDLNTIHKLIFKKLPEKFELKVVSLFYNYLLIIYDKNIRKMYDIKNNYNLMNFENIPIQPISLIQKIRYKILNLNSYSYYDIDSNLLKIIFKDGSICYYNEKTLKKLKFQGLKLNNNIIGLIEIYDYIFVQFFNGYLLYNKNYKLVSISKLKSGILIINMDIFKKILKLKTENNKFFYFNLEDKFELIDFKNFDIDIEIANKFFLNNIMFIKLKNYEHIILDNNYKKINLDGLKIKDKITKVELLNNIFKLEINNGYFLYYNSNNLERIEFEFLNPYDEIIEIKNMDNKLFININNNQYLLFNNDYTICDLFNLTKVKNVYTIKKYFILEYIDNNEVFNQNFEQIKFDSIIENCKFILDILVKDKLLIISYSNKKVVYSNNLNIKHKITEIGSQDNIYIEEIKNTNYYNIIIENFNYFDKHILLDNNLELFIIEGISCYDKIIRIFKYNNHNVIKTQDRMNLFYSTNFKKINLKGIIEEDKITYVDRFNNSIILQLNNSKRYLIFNKELKRLNIQNFKEDIIDVIKIKNYLKVKTKNFLFFIDSNNLKYFIIKGICKFKSIYEDNNLIIFKITDDEYKILNIKNLKKINFEKISKYDKITKVYLINKYIIIQIENKDFYFYNKINFTWVNFEKEELDNEKLLKLYIEKDIVNFETEQGNNYFDREYFDKLVFKDIDRKENITKKIYKSDDSDYYKVEIKKNYYSYYDIETYEKKNFEGISEKDITSEHVIFEKFLIMKVNNNCYKIYDKDSLNKIDIYRLGKYDIINSYKILLNTIILFINNKHYLIYDKKTFECVDYFLNKNERIIQLEHLKKDNYMLLRINKKRYYLFDVKYQTRIFFENSEIITEFYLLDEYIRILNENKNYFYYRFSDFKIIKFNNIKLKDKIVDIYYLDKFLKIKTSNKKYCYYDYDEINNKLEYLDFKTNGIEIVDIFSLSDFLIVKLVNGRHYIYSNYLEKIYLDKINYSEEIKYVNIHCNILVVGINNRVFYNYDSISLQKLYLKNLGVRHKIIDVVKFQRIFRIETNKEIYLYYRQYFVNNSYEYRNYIFQGVKRYHKIDIIKENKHFYKVIYQKKWIYFYKKNLKRVFFGKLIENSIKDIILTSNTCIKILFENGSKKYIINIS